MGQNVMTVSKKVKVIVVMALVMLVNNSVNNDNGMVSK